MKKSEWPKVTKIGMNLLAIKHERRSCGERLSAHGINRFSGFWKKDRSEKKAAYSGLLPSRTKSLTCTSLT